MHQDNSIFYKWIPKWAIVPILGVALFPHLMLMSIFSANSTFTASFLDIDIDDVQYLFSIMYAMFVCGTLLSVRFFHFFNLKTYLLIMTSINILILMAMTITKNYELIIVLRFLQGLFALLEGCILIPVLLSRLKSLHAKKIAYTILYGYMLTGATLTTSIVKIAIDNYDHNMMLRIVMFFHVGSLILYVSIFNGNRFFPKKPLYQLGLIGFLLLAAACLSGSFFFVYGKRYNWFDSDYIVIALIGALIFSGLFILQQATAKRPLFHFEVLKSKKVVIGMILFFIFYFTKQSISNIYQVMDVIWKWPWEFVLHMQYWIVYGSVIGLLTSLMALIKEAKFKYLFSLGFLFLGISFYWFSQLLVPDVAPHEVAPALFVFGLAQGILFTPLVLYILDSMNPSIMSHALLMGVTTRFWSMTVGFTVMQNSIWFLTKKHLTIITDDLLATNPIFSIEWDKTLEGNLSNHLNNDAISITAQTIGKKISIHTILISNIEIFTILTVITVLTSIVILFYSPVKKHFKKEN
ncbi:hypothetical protein [Chryseobacterium sp.]|uniref:hypothetical protein n=1 Tax=Chryseobacterium sp. TaxID=1871047 RepID=UPI00388EFDD5